MYIRSDAPGIIQNTVNKYLQIKQQADKDKGDKGNSTIVNT